MWSDWVKKAWAKQAQNVNGNYEDLLGGLGLVQPGTIPPPSDAGGGGSILDNITSAFQTIIPAYAQYRLTKENVRLVREGKQPLDPAMVAPVVKVQAGVSPQVQNTMRFALIGAGVLLGGALLMKAFRK